MFEKTSPNKKRRYEMLDRQVSLSNKRSAYMYVAYTINLYNLKQRIVHNYFDRHIVCQYCVTFMCMYVYVRVHACI